MTCRVKEHRTGLALDVGVSGETDVEIDPSLSESSSGASEPSAKQTIFVIGTLSGRVERIRSRSRRVELPSHRLRV